MQTENKEKVKRGEIYLHDFGNNEGSIQNGVRPVLVVQCDEGNQASTTTVVAALTSVIKKRYLPSHIILGEKFGLKEPSMVMLEQLKTVNQSELVEYIGFVDNEYLLRKVNHGLKKALGLWVDKPQKHSGIGITKLRQLSRQKKCLFVMPLGNQVFIVREKLDRYIKDRGRI